MSFSLSGKIVFVTGASRGAGAGIAREIAKAGGKLVLGYARNIKAAEAMRHELGNAVLGLVQADFAEPSAPENAWHDALDIAGGRLNGLVINHGIFEASGLEDTWWQWQENWARTLQVNLQSAADLARCAAKNWVDADGGTLIAISSRAAHRGDDADHTSYAASKAGMIAMIKTLARAHSGQGLIAYSVAPGWIDTKMAPQDPADRAAALSEVPYGDMAQPEELGALCAFLLSGACNSATGATFDVNGASYVR
jgi:NAD(P)-dependent dehydrogenase (short-subunit alcohol dehydrogenase family)